MILTTDRLLLRPWADSDAQCLYQYAKDDRVGPIAGWPPHQNVEESLSIIQTIFSQEGVFALTFKEHPEHVIGCIGLLTGAKSNFPIGEDEGEVSYWLGVPFWGQGLIPEAIREIIRYGFEDRNLRTLWCGYFVGNEQSKRAQEKCGFTYHHTNPAQYFPLTNDIRIEHVYHLPRQSWVRGKS